jgi:hypothetical protein
MWENQKVAKFGHTEITMLPVEVIVEVCLGEVDCMFFVEEVTIG